MIDSVIKGVIPEYFLNGLQGRDLTPVSQEMLLKFQYIALIPTHAVNFRYHLFKDGRLFFARNSEEKNNPIYNTALPDQPNRVLPPKDLARIRSALRKEGFFQQLPFIEVKARGGALMIISARRGRQVHEVWYVNANTPLTDLLFSITPEEHAAQSPEERLAALKIVLADQQRQLVSMQDQINAETQNHQPKSD